MPASLHGWAVVASRAPGRPGVLAPGVTAPCALPRPHLRRIRTTPPPWPAASAALLALLALLLAGCGDAPTAVDTGAGHAALTTARAGAPGPARPVAASLPPGGPRPSDVPRVVARVDGRPVATWLYLSQVNFQLALAATNPAPSGPHSRLSLVEIRTVERHALGAVIDNAMLVAYGEAHGWAPSRQEAADSYERVIQRRGGIAASLRQVAQEYLTVAQDRVVVRNRLVTEQVLDHFIAGLHQSIQAIVYRMIVTPSRARARQIRALLASTGHWVDLSARYSIDPVGRANGGEQPLLPRGQGEPGLQSLAFTLPPHVISAPVHLTRGWAVVEVLRRFPSPARLRLDLVRYRAWTSQLRRHVRISSYISPLW